MTAESRLPGVTDTRHVAVLVGSLGRHSCNWKLARALDEFVPASLRLECVDISRLPLYREIAGARPPLEWTLFRQQIRAADGVLLMTQEGARALPGVLRNAFDIGAHPVAGNAWEGKPCGVLSISPARNIGFAANHRLQKILRALNAPVMRPAQLSFGVADGMGMLFDDAGRLMNPLTRKSLCAFLHAFDAWVHTGSRH